MDLWSVFQTIDMSQGLEATDWKLIFGHGEHDLSIYISKAFAQMHCNFVVLEKICNNFHSIGIF